MCVSKEYIERKATVVHKMLTISEAGLACELANLEGAIDQAENPDRLQALKFRLEMKKESLGLK